MARHKDGETPIAASGIGDEPGEPRLIVTGLAGRGSEGHSPLVEATFSVRAGEIYGIAGVGGNGQTALAQALVGDRLPAAGTIELRGPGAQKSTAMTAATPRERRDHGVAAVPADRQSFGIATSLSITDNFCVGFVHDGRFGSPMLIDRGKEPRVESHDAGQPHRVAFQERVWLFMARTRNKPASPPVPGDAGAVVTDEPVRVISRAAAAGAAGLPDVFEGFRAQPRARPLGGG